MNKYLPGAQRQRRPMKIWDLSQARAAFPYLAAVVGSLREVWLEVSFLSRITTRRPSPRASYPRRLAHIEALERLGEAQKNLDQTRQELQKLDIFCLDAAAGQVLIPFNQEKQLAWFIFDLFEPEKIRYWRFHTDSSKKLRSLTSLGNRKTENQPLP